MLRVVPYCLSRLYNKKAVRGRPCPFKKEWRSLIICCKGSLFCDTSKHFARKFLVVRRKAQNLHRWFLTAFRFQITGAVFKALSKCCLSAFGRCCSLGYFCFFLMLSDSRISRWQTKKKEIKNRSFCVNSPNLLLKVNLFPLCEPSHNGNYANKTKMRT